MPDIVKINEGVTYSERKTSKKLSFEKGELFSAKVVGKGEGTNDVILRLSDGWQFPAKVDEDSELVQDQSSHFQVVGFEDGKIKLKKVLNEIYQQDNWESSIEELIKSSGMGLSKEDINTLKNMIKHDIPLIKENISEIKSLLFVKNRLNVDDNYCNQLIEKYLSSKNILPDSVEGKEVIQKLEKFFNQLKNLDTNELLTLFENSISLTGDNLESFNKIISGNKVIYSAIKVLEEGVLFNEEFNNKDIKGNINNVNEVNKIIKDFSINDSNLSKEVIKDIAQLKESLNIKNLDDNSIAEVLLKNPKVKEAIGNTELKVGNVLDLLKEIKNLPLEAIILNNTDKNNLFDKNTQKILKCVNEAVNNLNSIGTDPLNSVKNNMINNMSVSEEFSSNNSSKQFLDSFINNKDIISDNGIKSTLSNLSEDEINKIIKDFSINDNNLNKQSIKDIAKLKEGLNIQNLDDNSIVEVLLKNPKVKEAISNTEIKDGNVLNLLKEIKNSPLEAIVLNNLDMDNNLFDENTQKILKCINEVVNNIKNNLNNASENEVNKIVQGFSINDNNVNKQAIKDITQLKESLNIKNLDDDNILALLKNAKVKDVISSPALKEEKILNLLKEIKNSSLETIILNNLDMDNNLFDENTQKILKYINEVINNISDLESNSLNIKKDSVIDNVGFFKEIFRNMDTSPKQLVDSIINSKNVIQDIDYSINSQGFNEKLTEVLSNIKSDPAKAIQELNLNENLNKLLKELKEEIMQTRAEKPLPEVVKNEISLKLDDMKNIIKTLIEQDDINTQDLLNIYKDCFKDFKVYNELSNKYYMVDVPVNINRDTYECKLLIKDERKSGKGIDSKNVKIVASVKTIYMGQVDSYISVNDKKLKVNIKADEEFVSLLSKYKNNISKSLLELGYYPSVDVSKKIDDANMVTAREFFDDNKHIGINIKV